MAAPGDCGPASGIVQWNLRFPIHGCLAGVSPHEPAPTGVVAIHSVRRRAVADGRCPVVRRRHAAGGPGRGDPLGHRRGPRPAAPRQGPEDGRRHAPPDDPGRRGPAHRHGPGARLRPRDQRHRDHPPHGVGPGGAAAAGLAANRRRAGRLFARADGRGHRHPLATRRADRRTPAKTHRRRGGHRGQQQRRRHGHRAEHRGRRQGSDRLARATGRDRRLLPPSRRHGRRRRPPGRGRHHQQDPPPRL